MTTTDDDNKFGRVFVILDVTSNHLPALESAAALASRFDAQLVGLFVEGDEIERLEQNPVARAIDLPTGVNRHIERGSLRRSSRAMARRMQRRLGQLAQRYRVEVNFELMRGDVASQLGGVSQRNDLLVVDSSGRSVTRHVRMTSRGHAMGCRLPGPVMFVGTGRPRLNSVALLYDGSPRAVRGLQTALQLGANQPVMLTILLAGDSAGEIDDLKQDVARRIGEYGVPIRPHIRRITCCDTDEIARVCSNVHANFVILPASEDYPADEDIDELMERLDAPVLVLGDGDEAESVGSSAGTADRRAESTAVES